MLFEAEGRMWRPKRVSNPRKEVTPLKMAVATGACTCNPAAQSNFTILLYGSVQAALQFYDLYFLPLLSCPPEKGPEENSCPFIN